MKYWVGQIESNCEMKKDIHKPESKERDAVEQAANSQMEEHHQELIKGKQFSTQAVENQENKLVKRSASEAKTKSIEKCATLVQQLLTRYKTVPFVKQPVAHVPAYDPDPSTDSLPIDSPGNAFKQATITWQYDLPESEVARREALLVRISEK